MFKLRYAALLLIASVAWGDVTSIVTFPGGTNGSVQTNKNGRFNGDSFLTYSTATHFLNSPGISISTLTANGISYTFPSSQTGGYFLQVDGAGGLSWQTPSTFSVSSGTSLAVYDGAVKISSPTGALIYNASQFIVSLQGATTAAISVDPSSVTLLGPSIDLASEVTGSLPAASIASGNLGASVVASSIAVNAVKDASIVSVSGSKVTGNIPGNAVGITGSVNVSQVIGAIQNQNTLQTGATFYVSSGTVLNELNAGQIGIGVAVDPFSYLTVQGGLGGAGNSILVTGSGGQAFHAKTTSNASIYYTVENASVTAKMEALTSESGFKLTVQNNSGISKPELPLTLFTQGSIAGPSDETTATLYKSSFTATNLVASNGLTAAIITDTGLNSGECVQTTTGGRLTTTGSACGSGSGGGSSTDLVPGDTDYIQNRITLQSGSTFYVSSGSVKSSFSLAYTSNVLTAAGVPYYQYPLLVASNTLVNQIQNIGYFQGNGNSLVFTGKPDVTIFDDLIDVTAISDAGGPFYGIQSRMTCINSADSCQPAGGAFFGTMDTSAQTGYGVKGFVSGPGTGIGVYGQTGSSAKPQFGGFFKSELGSNVNYGAYLSAANGSNNYGLYVGNGQAFIGSSMTVTGAGGISNTYGITTGSLTVSAAGDGGAIFTIGSSTYGVLSSSFVIPSGHLLTMNSTNYTVGDGGTGSGGATTAAGTLNAVQYNNPAGTFAGSNNFQFNGTSVTVVGPIVHSTLTVLNNATVSANTGNPFIDIYEGNTPVAGTRILATFGTNQQADQIVITDLQPLNLIRYGVNAGGLRIGRLTNNQKIYSDQSITQYVEIWNTGLMEFKTATTANGGKDFVFYPQQTETVRISSISVNVVSSMTVRGANGLGVIYGATLGSATVNNLTGSQYVKTDSNKTLASQSGVPTTDLTGTLQAGQFPALTGAVTTSAGALATTLNPNQNQVVTWSSSQTVTAPLGVSVTYGVAVGSITGSGLSTCGDSTHALAWTSGTNLFSCQAITASGGSSSAVFATTGTSSGFTGPPVSSPIAGIIANSSQFTSQNLNSTTFYFQINTSSITAQGPVVSSISVNSVYPGAVQSGVYSNITGVGAQGQALNLNTHLINGVVDPVSAQDAVTKAYADSLKISLSTGVVGTLPAAQEPAHTGDVTNSAGSLAMAAAASQPNINTFTASSITVTGSSGLRLNYTNVTQSTGTPLTTNVNGVVVSSSGVNLWKFTSGTSNFTIPTWGRMAYIHACGGGGSGAGGEGRATANIRSGASGGGGGFCWDGVIDLTQVAATSLAVNVASAATAGAGGSTAAGTGGSQGPVTSIYIVGGSTLVYAWGGGGGLATASSGTPGGTGGSGFLPGANATNSATMIGGGRLTVDVGMGLTGAGTILNSIGLSADWGGGGGGGGSQTNAGSLGGVSIHGDGGGGGSGGCTTANVCAAPAAGGMAGSYTNIAGGGGAAGTSGASCTAGTAGADGNLFRGGSGGGAGGGDQDSTAVACTGGAGGLCGGGGGAGGPGTSVGAAGGAGGPGCVFIEVW